jgi:1,5-anhydro-D-fructose reductase (1,5-anhydro-D-mannitol-forming)
MTLGWAMVGTGWHVRDRMAPAARLARDTRLVAVCSRDLSRAQAYATDFGFERAYDSYSALLADDDVAVVYLATPNHLHESQTIQAARAGKHVLVEKPMALTIAGAERMVDACRDRNVKLSVGFHSRHHPAHIHMRELLQGGTLGKPLLISMEWVKANALRDGWWRDPEQVGAYVTMARGVHLIDLMAFLTGHQPLEVSATSDGQRDDQPLEDTILATFRMQDETFGHLVASRLFQRTENRLEIFCSEGRALASGTLGTDGGGSLEVWTSDDTTRTTYTDHSPYQAEIESFNRSILENTEPNCSGLDGLNAVRVTNAVLESAHTRKSVPLGPLAEPPLEVEGRP